MVDPFRDLVNAGEEALFTVELDGVAFRLGDRGRIKAGEFGPAHHDDLRAGRQGEADAHVGADQQPAADRRQHLPSSPGQEDPGADGEQVGGKRFMEYRVARRRP